MNAGFEPTKSAITKSLIVLSRTQRAEKGNVEKNLQDSRRRIWIDAGNHRFGSFAALNVWLGARCRALWGKYPIPNTDSSA
jgi:hypothetical protein